MTKKKYVKLRGENTMIALIIFFILATVFVNFIGQANIQSNNSELQRLKSKIETQEKLNASMQMKINELACLDNALEVADTFGLEYNNSNIRVVSDIQE
jgi:cell division protein FtsL